MTDVDGWQAEHVEDISWFGSAQGGAVLGE